MSNLTIHIPTSDAPNLVVSPVTPPTSPVAAASASAVSSAAAAALSTPLASGPVLTEVSAQHLSLPGDGEFADLTIEIPFNQVEENDTSSNLTPIADLYTPISEGSFKAILNQQNIHNDVLKSLQQRHTLGTSVDGLNYARFDSDSILYQEASKAQQMAFQHNLFNVSGNDDYHLITRFARQGFAIGEQAGNVFPAISGFIGAFASSISVADVKAAFALSAGDGIMASLKWFFSQIALLLTIVTAPVMKGLKTLTGAIFSFAALTLGTLAWLIALNPVMKRVIKILGGIIAGAILVAPYMLAKGIQHLKAAYLRSITRDVALLKEARNNSRKDILLGQIKEARNQGDVARVKKLEAEYENLRYVLSSERIDELNDKIMNQGFFTRLQRNVVRDVIDTFTDAFSIFGINLKKLGPFKGMSEDVSLNSYRRNQLATDGVIEGNVTRFTGDEESRRILLQNLYFLKDGEKMSTADLRAFNNLVSDPEAAIEEQLIDGPAQAETPRNQRAELSADPFATLASDVNDNPFADQMNVDATVAAMLPAQPDQV